MSVFVTISLPVTAVPLGDSLGETTGVTVELERVVPTGSTTHYVWVIGDDYEPVLEALRPDPSVKSVDVLEALDDRRLVRIRWKCMDTPLFDIVEEIGSILVDATGTADGWTMTLQFADGDALARFYETCRQRGVAFELDGLTESRFGDPEDEFGLTPLQSETLAAAFEAGYFDVPRKTTLAELAERLGVSEQAVSERLRRGLGRFIAEMLSHDEPSDTTETDRD